MYSILKFHKVQISQKVAVTSLVKIVNNLKKYTLTQMYWSVQYLFHQHCLWYKLISHHWDGY